MKTHHHGAVSGVTGSCHELFLDDSHSILIDCGLFQGAETARRSSAESLAIEFDITAVQALVVTHCHIDHVGRIPYLLAAGFVGPIYATEATAGLLPLVIEDALRVGVTRNRSIIGACLDRLNKQLVAVPYGEWKSLMDTELVACAIRFQPAGHILGSAYVEVDVVFGAEGGSDLNGNSSKRVVFSGDLGASHTPLLPEPLPPERADVIVIESTYGDRLHANREQRVDQLRRVLQSAIADNGVVIIPAFSIGRTQELLYEIESILNEFLPEDPLSTVDVIVDSPLAAKFTEYYKRYRHLWDTEAKQTVAEGRHPLDFDMLYTVGDHAEHEQTIDYLDRRNKPAIILAASGMCSGGRVVNYLKRFLSDATTDVLFVGYQARGTLGRDIQTYAGRENGYVVIDGARVSIGAQVHVLPGYSAHADQADLVRFVAESGSRPEKVIIVHGDEEAKRELAEVLAPVVDEVVIAGEEDIQL